MTRKRHLEVTFIPRKGTPFTINPRASAIIQPQTFIKFQVEKQLSSEPNGAVLTLYNLSDDHSGALDFRYDTYSNTFGPTVIISGGYIGEGISQMYTGVITSAITVFHPPDYVTTVNCINAYGELMNRPITYQAAENTPKSDAIINIIRQAGGLIESGQEAELNELFTGVIFGEDEAVDETLGSFLTKIKKTYPKINVYWDDAGVSFNPTGKAATGRPVKVVSESSGLIGSPKATNTGLEYETRLDPTYRISDPVKVISFVTARLAVSSGGPNPTKSAVPNKPDPSKTEISVVSSMIHSGDNRDGDFKTSVETHFVDTLNIKAQ